MKTKTILPMPQTKGELENHLSEYHGGAPFDDSLNEHDDAEFQCALHENLHRGEPKKPFPHKNAKGAAEIMAFGIYKHNMQKWLKRKPNHEHKWELPKDWTIPADSILHKEKTTEDKTA